MFKFNSKFFRLFLASIFLTAVAAAADNKQSIVTFNSWVEVPGGILPAGSYIFKLTHEHSATQQIEISDLVTRIHVATVPASMVDRPDSALESNVIFEGRPFPNAEAVKAWFRPGSRKGEEFIYSNASQPLLTAMVGPANTESAMNQPAANQATPVEPSSTEAPRPQVAAPEVVAPDSVEKERGTVQQQAEPRDPQSAKPASEAATPSAPVTTPAATSAAVEESSGTAPMPKTASSFPLFWALGAGALGAALTLRLVRR